MVGGYLLYFRRQLLVLLSNQDGLPVYGSLGLFHLYIFTFHCLLVFWLFFLLWRLYFRFLRLVCLVGIRNNFFRDFLFAYLIYIILSIWCLIQLLFSGRISLHLFSLLLERFQTLHSTWKLTLRFKSFRIIISLILIFLFPFRFHNFLLLFRTFLWLFYSRPWLCYRLLCSYTLVYLNTLSYIILAYRFIYLRLSFLGRRFVLEFHLFVALFRLFGSFGQDWFSGDCFGFF